MQIHSLDKFKYNPSFGYSSPLKTLYLKGDLPVKYGFYGDRLNTKNVSLEHLLPRSKGGKTELSNLVLASKEKNQIRGNQPLSKFINLEALQIYVNQFRNIKRDNFNGNAYIKGILNTITRLIRDGK